MGLSYQGPLGPGHTKDFFSVLAKTRGIFPGFHDIRGRRQICRAAFSSSLGVDEFRRVFKLEGAKAFVRVKRFFSAKVNPPRRWPNFWCDGRLRFGQLDAGRRSGIPLRLFGVTRPLGLVSMQYSSVPALSLRARKITTGRRRSRSACTTVSHKISDFTLARSCGVTFALRPLLSVPALGAFSSHA